MTHHFRLLHRRNLALASLFLCLCAPISANADSYGVLQTVAPQQVPALQLMQADKAAAQSQADWQGQVGVLNFWATWCAPCVKEMPSLNALAKHYAGKPVLIVPAAQDITGFLTIKTFYRRQKLDALPLFWDKDTASFQALGLNVLPASFVLDQKGQMIARVDGTYDWNSEEMHRLIDAALAEKNPADDKLAEDEHAHNE